jgi:hypothetical protein
MKSILLPVKMKYFIRNNVMREGGSVLELQVVGYAVADIIVEAVEEVVYRVEFLLVRSSSVFGRFRVVSVYICPLSISNSKYHIN